MKYVCNVEVSAHKKPESNIIKHTHFITEIKSTVSMVKLTATKTLTHQVVQLDFANTHIQYII